MGRQLVELHVRDLGVVDDVTVPVTTPTPDGSTALTPAAEPLIWPMALARSRWLSGTSMAIEAWNAGCPRAANSDAQTVSA